MPKTITLESNAEFNTILAALRYYQENDQGNPDSRSDAIHEIACGEADGMSEDISLDAKGIDALCERINTASEPPATEEQEIAALALVRTIARMTATGDPTGPCSDCYWRQSNYCILHHLGMIGRHEEVGCNAFRTAAPVFGEPRQILDKEGLKS
jgi:hypothetical protein